MDLFQAFALLFAGSVRDREQQVDLAVVVQDDSAPRPPVEVLDREGRRSGLTARLQEQLDARSGPARGRAALILAHLRLPQGVTRLEPMLDDDDPDVRLVAVAGPPLAEDPDAVPALVRAQSKRRLAPERVIERLGMPWAVELLERGSLEERISAARALGTVGGRRARPVLEHALSDEAWPLRAQAAKALGSIGIKRPSRPRGRARRPRLVGAGERRERVALARRARPQGAQARPRPSRPLRPRPAREALAMDRVGG